MDYSKSFEPVGYSDGESVMAFSDAQNVDFGLGVNPRGFGSVRKVTEKNGANYVVNNALAESGVSAFGSVRYPFGDTEKRRKTREIPVAAKLAKGGPGRTAGYVTGTVAGGMTSGNAARPADAVSNIGGVGINRQKETARALYFVGQLGG